MALDVLEHALVSAGHDVLPVRTAADAMQLLCREESRLVITDWVMPGMDGIELCRQIRQASFDAYVYVILLTSRSDVEDLAEALEAGADDFVSKPFHPMALQARVRAAERILALETRTSAAEAANRAKSEFLANMSHEIRTPMTAILGFAENLGDRQISEDERREAIETIQRNGTHLLSIINDILDLSKIEAGQLECEQIDYSPCQLLIDLDSAMGARARNAGLDFAIECAEPLPRVVRGDPTRVRQIVINLVGNAIKFTQRGGVRLLPRLERHGPANAWLHFDVIDTGIGMTGEQAAHVFQPFAQADTSMTRKYGGTGLGLTICKQLAELLGGEVNIVRTQPGVGTHIRVSFPTGPLDGVSMVDCPKATAIVEGEPRQNETTEAEGRLARRILLAEDGPDNQRIIAHVLRKAGAEVTVVENGQVALESALDAQAENRSFDVILMDMQMPVMDGYQATGLLRQRGYAGQIIALTAHAMLQDRQKCLDAGCDNFATKPIKRHELLELLGRRTLRKVEPHARCPSRRKVSGGDSATGEGVSAGGSTHGTFVGSTRGTGLTGGPNQ
jgi:signal transduction histidine kinase